MPSVAEVSSALSRKFRSLPPFGSGRNESLTIPNIVRISPFGVDRLMGHSGSTPATALVPAEHILLLAVDLPAPRRRDRLAALPWAIEDLIVEPFSALHIVLGREISPQRYLVAVVRHETMRAWRDMLESGGFRRCRIVPDALALPLATGGFWSVAVDGDRILVRDDAATAFAVQAPLFPVAWESAGRPQIELYGEQAFPPIASVPHHSTIADSRALNQILGEGAGHQPLDLAQGLYAPEGNAAFTALRRTGFIAGAGAVAYTAILAADTAAIAHLADRRTAEAAQLQAEIVPADRRSGDIAADIAALSRLANSPHGVFLPLLGKASAALRPFVGEVSLRTLAFSAEDNALTFGIDVRDFAALQKVESALTANGIAVETGPAAAAAGGVEAKVTMRDRAAL